MNNTQNADGIIFDDSLGGYGEMDGDKLEREFSGSYSYAEAFRMNHDCAMALCHTPCNALDVDQDAYRRSDPAQSYYDPCQTSRGMVNAHIETTLVEAKRMQLMFAESVPGYRGQEAKR